jgi:ATP-dependent DNA helicase RecQ
LSSAVTDASHRHGLDALGGAVLPDSARQYKAVKALCRPAIIVYVSADPERLLHERFGLSAFRPGQREVIDALLTHGSALAVFPTGGGKSLCYQLPALAFEGVTLVVSPLIALMKDQIDYLQGRGIAAARLDSSLSATEARQVTDGLRSGSLRILYVAPERFNNERFLNELRRTRIALFAVDEAHCISEWGHNFRPDYLKLAETARVLGAERVLALTATATPTVVNDICAGFEIPRECAVVTGVYRSNLSLYITPVTVEERYATLAERLSSRPPGPSIVYVTLQRTAEQVAHRLAKAGLPARAYHAGMDADARTQTQEWWMASDRGIVVATIAFGMGIDKANVRYVYHYNLPKSLESYSQEMGRAGRDGEQSVVELLACPADVPTLENFAYGDTPTLDALNSVVTALLETGGNPFDVSLTELSTRHDIRPLVLRTVLTYLELLGVLHQGTPFYAGYEAKPLVQLSEILARFSGERRGFLARIFAAAKKGRIWYGLNPVDLAPQLGSESARVVRALEYLDEQGLIELRASEPRLRFTRVDDGPASSDPQTLVRALAQRFQRREEQEIQRLQQVLQLAEHDGCQSAALASYFGQELQTSCGHCSFCETGRALTLPVVPAPPPIESVVDVGQLAELCAAHPIELGHARGRARFLCGLSGPAFTQARLSRQPLFGVLEERRFGDVLAWCQQLAREMRSVAPPR